MPEKKKEETKKIEISTDGLEEIQNNIVDQIKARDEAVKARDGKIDEQLRVLEETGKANQALAGEVTEAKTSVENICKELVEMRHEMNLPGSIEGGGEAESISKKFLDDPKVKDYLERGTWQNENTSVRLDIEGSILGYGQKTDITSATVGSATSGILVPQRVVDLVKLPERQLRIRDILPSRPVTANAIEFPYENVFTNATSPQTEASDKAESALTYDIGTAAVRTIATWIPATDQVLSDWVALGRHIENKLIYGLRKKEEEEILSGSGSGVHLNGLTTQATSYAGTYNVASDQNLDRLRWAILEVEDDDEECDFIVLHPKNFWTILGIKDAASNIGNYIYGQPQALPIAGVKMWGKTVIVSTAMTADYFLVGSTRQCEVFDRMQMRIAISTEHSDYFIKNMAAIRIESRIAFAVYRTTSFVYGGF